MLSEEDLEDAYSCVYEDSNIEIYKCAHSAVLVNDNESWVVDHVVHSDSYIDCFPSFDFDTTKDVFAQIAITKDVTRHTHGCDSKRNHPPIKSRAECVVDSDPLTELCKQKKDKRRCSARDCAFHASSYCTFPRIVKDGRTDQREVQRCRQWIQLSGNLDLLKKETPKLYKQNFFCAEHFETNQFTSEARKRLNKNAVPSIFPNSTPLTEDQMASYPNLGQSVTLDLLFRDEEGMNDVASNIDSFQRHFEENMSSLEWRICSLCNVKFFCESASKKTCMYTKPVCHKNTLIKVDQVPNVLRRLSFIEEQLIARIHPIVTVMKLKNHQLGYKGNIINFPQDIQGFASKLPHKISDLRNVITVRASKDLKPVDFQVRADYVREALEFLKEKNRYYYDIDISLENLDSLPQNGNVFDSIQGINVYDEDGITEENDSEDDNDMHDMIFESGNPIMAQAAEKDQINNVIDYPTIGSEPINEFTEEGFIAKAFPCLFPEGNGDFTSAKTSQERKRNAIRYIKHLMQYKDDRFHQHPRFRYFSLNLYMRWSALRNGNLFVRKQPELDEMTLDNLKTHLQNDQNLIKKIMFQSSNIHGSRAYWFARGKELLAMVEQIGLPTLFFTLSAADLHWPALFRLLAPGEDLQSLSEHRRRQLVKENPQTVDSFFLLRVETFLKEVVFKKYNVKDIWFRIEYQSRGSPHVHGVFWMEGAPDVSNVKNLTIEEQQQIVDYFSKLVTAVHPNISQPPPDIHPCRRTLMDVEDLDTDLAELLNRVQRHTQCSQDYCIRQNKVTKQSQCRFKFPQEYNNEAKLEVNDSDVEFLPERNDDRLNKYNRYMIQTWRANMDIAPVVSKKALINYLTKYISKPEEKSKQFTDVVTTINEACEKNRTVKYALQRLYIKLCSERDFSAQETCHLLQGLKLFSSGGRQFVKISFSSHQEWRKLRKDGGATDFIEKYQMRSEALEDKCMWELAKKYHLPAETKYKDNKEAIVQVFPKYRLKITSSETEDFEKYYRQQVLLYVPWRDEAAVKGSCTTWKEAYQQNLNMIKTNTGQTYSLENITPDEDELEEPEEETDFNQEEWMALSAMGPGQPMEKVDLGSREIDLAYDWHSSFKEYEQYGGIPGMSCFIKNNRSQQTMNKDAPQNTAEKTNIVLNEDQKRVMELLNKQLIPLNNKNPDTPYIVPRKIIIQGRAGTGKSLLIAKMIDTIKQTLKQESYILLGPTGVSANNINGATINSKLRIYPGAEFVPLRGTILKKFIEELEHVIFIIIDEYSMVGTEMLYKIDQRLRQGKESEEEFGGMFIYMFGDFNQLPPVGDYSVFATTQPTMEALSGKALYDTFDSAIFLEKIHRQDSECFQQILNNVSNGNMTKEDYSVLRTRFTTEVTGATRKEFDKEMHLYPTNESVRNHNKNKLACARDPCTNSLIPIAKIQAKFSDKKHAKIQQLKDNVLEPTLYLSKGCNIMLRKNLWTERGLVNGAVGEVIDILYHPDTSPQQDAPAVLICRFKSYKGPFLDAERQTVPIVPIQQTFKDDEGNSFCVSQFPVSLCFACTIHKSQGITVEKVFIDLGKREMRSGLSYVALSRVKSLEGLLLEPFQYPRYQAIGRSKAIQQRQDWANSLKQILYVSIS